MLTVLIVILIVILIMGLPQWQRHDLGYFPSSVVGLIVIVLLILLLTGRL